MKELVFLLEEPSMREVLNVLLPKLLPDDIGFKLIVHHGKQELEKYLPSRLRQWRTPQTRFVIMPDQNSDDCIKLKQRFKRIKYGLIKKKISVDQAIISVISVLYPDNYLLTQSR